MLLYCYIKLMKMKKLVLTFTMSLVVYVCFAQITSIDPLSEKNYDDNTKTVYLQMNGYIPVSIKSEIEDELTNLANVKFFSFYDETDLSNCMITCSTEFDLNDIVGAINNLISKSYDTKNLFDLPGTFYDNSTKVVKFITVLNSDLVNLNALLDELRNVSGIILCEVNSDGVFKIILNKNTPWYDVDRIFKEKGVKEIIPIF